MDEFEYRIIRPVGSAPEGTQAVIWRSLGDEDVTFTPPISQVVGPWRYEGRKLPDGEWELLDEGVNAKPQKAKKDLNERVDQAYKDNKSWWPELADNVQHHTLGLAGEAGEVSNFVKKYDRGSISEDTLRTELKGELADVLVYVFSLAAILGIDLEIAYDNKRKFNTERYTHG